MEHAVLGSSRLLDGQTAQVVLDNRWARFIDGPIDALRSYFRYRPPGYYFSLKYRLHQWDGYICLLRHGRVATGLFLHFRSQIEAETGVQFHVQDTRTSPRFRRVSLDGKTRAYQEECVQAMQRNSNLGGLILCATGTGKTFLAGIYCKRLMGAACFVVDELTLLEQARRELKTVLGEDVGVIGDSVFRPRRVTVATVQTLHRHRQDPVFLAWSRKLETIIVDEVHLALNRRNIDVVGAIRPRAVFGLTATLELKRHDVQLRAIALAGPPLFEYNLKTGVREGFLSHGAIGRVLLRAAGANASYQQEYRRLVSHNRRRNDCIEALCREGLRRGKRVVVLVERLAHLRILSRRWVDLPHAVICGAVPKDERFAAKTAMDAGQLSLVLATRVFSKGIDIRTVNVIIDATASRSHNSAIQRYGRGVRRAEGKKGLLYFDIADVSVTDDGVKNRFAACSRSRLQALRTLGVSVTTRVWENTSASDFYDHLETRLIQVSRTTGKAA